MTAGGRTSSGTCFRSVPRRAAALTAAKRAAAEQHVPGEAAYIEYQDEAGCWHTEFSAGDDRPDADVTG